MPEPIATLNEDPLRSDLRELVRRTVGDTLNGPLEAEADDLAGAGRFGRAVREVFPGAPWQRCVVQLERDVVSALPTRAGRGAAGRVLHAVVVVH